MKFLKRTDPIDDDVNLITFNYLFTEWESGVDKKSKVSIQLSAAQQKYQPNDINKQFEPRCSFPSNEESSSQVAKGTSYPIQDSRPTDTAPSIIKYCIPLA